MTQAIENERIISAKKLFWEMDCQECWESGIPFLVTDIERTEDRNFVEQFEIFHNGRVLHSDGSAEFIPDGSSDGAGIAGIKGSTLKGVEQ